MQKREQTLSPIGEVITAERKALGIRKDTKKQARNMKFTSLFFTASADHFRDLPQK